MGTLNSLYVRASDPASVTAVNQRYPSAQHAPGSAFIEMPLPIGDPPYPTSAWAELSRLVNAPVFHLLFQSTVDAFRFQRFENGKSIRALQHGCVEQGTWEVAEGTPEPWEVTAFFSDTAQLDDMREDPDWEDIERAWVEHRLEAGRFFPLVNAREAARAAAEHHRFPGWEVT